MTPPQAVRGVFIADSQLEPVLLRSKSGKVYQLKLNEVSDNQEMVVFELVDIQTRVVRLFETKMAGIGGREEDQSG